MTSDRAEPIMTEPDQIQPGNLGVLAYYKPALGLRMLRESIIGEELFDEAFRAYINRWAFKHPRPNDFFNTMEDVAGQELDWFWRGWFATTWTMDQAVDSVKYVEDAAANGALISISNRQDLVMPVSMEITQQNGTKEMVRLPAQVWQKGDTWTVKYQTETPVSKVVIDPHGEFPDTDLSNNTWISTDTDSSRN
jgi:aminopeptidase N